MTSTLKVDSTTHEIIVASKYWSDFGSHLPLIRSFVSPANWPPQHPLFPGEKIKYHYLFFAVAGFLESLGVRLDWALNIGSIGGLISLATLLVIISYRLTRSVFVSIVSGLCIFFNSSFSWIDYLHKYPLSALPQLKDFVSFRPWNESLVGAFWTLNIYSNQRHLALSFAIVLLLVYILLFKSRRLVYTFGFLLGSLLLLNQAAFLIAVIFCVWLWVFASGIRTKILISLIGFFPWLFIYLNTISLTKLDFKTMFDPGFIAPQPLTPASFIKFWFYNLGTHLLFLPLGFLFAPKKLKILLVPILVIFILGNLFRFSPDIFNNHKFFNFIVLILAVYSSYFLLKISQIKFVGKLLTLTLTLTLFLGGIVDIFPLINDTQLRLSDIPSNPDAQYFASSTPPDAVVLNSTWFYHPASIAGRSIFNGYSYFTWSYGYDQVAREALTKEIFLSPTKSLACELLSKNNISYVELSQNPENFIIISRIWETEFFPEYGNVSGIKVFNVSTNCRT